MECRGGRLGQLSGTHQVAVAFSGGTATFIERPHDEALTAAAIACSEYSRDIGRVLLELGFRVGAWILFDLEGIEEGGFRAEEAHGEEDELGGNGFFGARHFLGHEATLVVLFPADLDSESCFDPAVFVGDEFLYRGEVGSRVIAEAGCGFFLSIVDFQDLGPFRPGVIPGTFLGGLGQDFELGERAASVAQ